MKRQPNLALALTAGAFLLIGIPAIAQKAPKAKTGSSPKTQPRDIAVDHAGGNGVQRAVGNSSGTQPQDIAVDHAGGNGVQRAVGSSSGTQPQDIAVDHAGGTGTHRVAVNKTGTPQSGATTAAAQARSKKHLAGVKYQDRTNSGKTSGNPPFEPKGK